MKIEIALVILLITLLAGIFPFYKKRQNAQLNFPIAETLACGVFLGAGLIHMLGDAAQNFSQLGYSYPFAFLIAGGSFLFLLMLEHIGQELQHHAGNTSGFAILAAVMLSLHSLFEGAAVGLSNTWLTTLILAFAIIAHKWAASFSLAWQLNRSALPFSFTLIAFLIFAIMTPLGIIGGEVIQHNVGHYPLLTPIFTALAAGTFLYIGTLHGLRQATMIERCCNLKEFSFMLLGFSIMAIVAIWT
ncbi:MAG: zinc transporter [Gammaproteobacteria bacterium]|jgi:zinc transporter ZupT|nr:zinc transporter [Gammaproteobacteria bacterium]